MNVTFLQDHKMGVHSFKVGQTALIITSIAEELIEQGVCEANKNVTLRDKIVEDIKEDQKEADTGQTQEVKEATPKEVEKPKEESKGRKRK